MKRPIALLLLPLVLAGCNTRPKKATFAGIYTSNPVRQSAEMYHRVDGRERAATKELTLTLYPNGTYDAWWRVYLDGQLVRFSGLATYDLQTNSAGTWTIKQGKLMLRSTGPASGTTGLMLKAMGRSISPEESQADVVRRDGHWVITWMKTEYFFSKSVPNPQGSVSPAHATGPG